MTLWIMMIVVCFFMPIAGAISAGRDLHWSWGLQLGGIALGILLGAGFAWVLHAVGRLVVSRYRSKTEFAARWPFRLLYFAGALWMIAALFLGGWAAELIPRLF
jgi:hypothetical protein